MKKVLPVLMAVMMMFSFCMTAAADTTPTAHTYRLYQVFAGTQSGGDGDAELASIQWGTGVNGPDLLAALKAAGDAYDSCITAQDVAAVLNGYGDGSDAAMAFARLAYENKAGEGVVYESGMTLYAGYWLVVDTTEFADGETYTYRNLALLQLTNEGSFDIATKVEIPEFQKKVKDINDSTDTAYTGWQDSADHDMTDAVPYQLKGTLQEIETFNAYKVVFHDTLPAGHDAPTDFVVKIQNTTGEPITLTSAQYTLEMTGNDFVLTIADVLALGAEDDAVVTVEYKAVLNTEAKLGEEGNPSQAYMEYSNNPNQAATDTQELGRTRDDKVTVFTYQVTANKVDEKKAPLTGAGFTLYKLVRPAEGDAAYTPVGDEIKGENLTEFVWKGVDDGSYKLVETTVPSGYNQMADLEFTVTAKHDAESDDPQLTSLSGGDTFTANKTEGNAYTGVLSGEVVNYKGMTLPETGGIGTNIFYAVGGVLVIGALILLITKKRMSAEK